MCLPIQEGLFAGTRHPHDKKAREGPAIGLDREKATKPTDNRAANRRVSGPPIHDPLTPLPLDGPLRPQDFRWQLANFKLEHGWLPREWWDPWIREACSFIGALRKCKSGGDHLTLKRKYPYHYGAWQLSERRPPHMRWEVEARILAQESFDKIGESFAMHPKVIAMYERLFFAVLDRINAKGYIQHQIICWPRGKEPDLGVIWRYYGYTGGPVVLDAIIHGGNPDARPAGSNDITAYATKYAQFTLAIKAMVAAQIMPVNASTALKFVKRWLQIEKARSRSKTNEGLPFELHLRAFLDGLDALEKRPTTRESEIVGKLPSEVCKLSPGLPSVQKGEMGKTDDSEMKNAQQPTGGDPISAIHEEWTRPEA